MAQTATAQRTGKVVQVIGPVIDIEFTEGLPEIYNAVRIDSQNKGVSLHLVGEGLVERCAEAHDRVTLAVTGERHTVVLRLGIDVERGAREAAAAIVQSDRQNLFERRPQEPTLCERAAAEDQQPTAARRDERLVDLAAQDVASDVSDLHGRFLRIVR